MRKARRPSRPSVYAYITLGGLVVLAAEAATLKVIQVWLGLDYGRHVNVATLAAAIVLAVASCTIGWWLTDRCRRADLAEQGAEIIKLRQRADAAEDQSWWGNDAAAKEDLEKTVDLARVPDNLRFLRPGQAPNTKSS